MKLQFNGNEMEWLVFRSAIMFIFFPQFFFLNLFINSYCFSFFFIYTASIRLLFTIDMIIDHRMKFCFYLKCQAAVTKHMFLHTILHRKYKKKIFAQSGREANRYIFYILLALALTLALAIYIFICTLTLCDYDARSVCP